ncbi:MAG: hypothetical protein ACK524_25090 [Planctomyces sp.]
MRLRGRLPTTQHERSRALLLRLLAVLTGCLPLLAAELACHLLGLGITATDSDPFVGFAGSRPLFELSDDRSAYRISAARLNFFRPASFPARKTPGTTRIFVLGGSTVQGHPFSTETAFPRLLQLSLERLHPARRWEVINCGGVSYASYRLLPVLQEVLQYEPDICIFCEGQNEFLEDVAYGTRRGLVETAAPLLTPALRLRCVRAILRWVSESDAAARTASRPLLPAEVLTRLDQSDGLARFHRNDAQSATVVQHFRHTLQRMVHLCRERKVPLVFVQPPVNLADCPPFKTQFAVDAEQQRQVLELLQRARAEAAADRSAAVRLAQQAVLLDERCALAWYELGQLQLTAGDFESAKISLQRAVDEDVCPLRMTTPLQRTLQQVASEQHVPLLNADSLLAGVCRGGIVSEQVLVDHVHPSFRGHEDIAVALAELLLSEGLTGPAAAGWQQSARTACRAVVQGLDDTYFLRGRRTLEALRKWAAGRALEPDGI